MESNQFVCPRCGLLKNLSDVNPNKFNDGGTYRYHCPNCTFEVPLTLQIMDWEWNQDSTHFVEQFFRLRGYKGRQDTWTGMALYLRKFLRGDRERVQSWDEMNPGSYEIVVEYFERQPEDWATYEGKWKETVKKLKEEVET